MQRLRHQLREYFPAALEAFEDLDAPDTLELLGKAPDPASRGEADPRAGQRGAQARPPPRHHGQGRRDPGGAAQRAAGPARGADRRLRRRRPVPDRGDHHPERAGQDPGRAGEGAFRRHPDAEIYQSQPGLAAILGARVLGEFGDDPAASRPGKPGRTTAAPARSPAPPARRRSSPPGSSTTTGSSTPS